MINISERQYGTPLILTTNKGPARRLDQIPFGTPPFREDRLQQLLAEHPELVPITEIEPAFSPLVFLGREVPTSVGSLDVLYASPSGYLTMVETKLWDNPEARRQVVAQIIDYATEIARWSFDDFNQAVRNSLSTSGLLKSSDSLQIMKKNEGDFDEANFIDAVTRNLARGYFMLLIVGNGIREGVEEISKYLQQAPGLHFSLAMVELNLYRVTQGEDFPLYIQPRTIARTVELVRAVVDVKAPPEFKVDIAVPTEETGKLRRKLTESIFYEELAENTNEETAAEVKLLVQEMQDMGVVPVWRASSVSIRYPDPGGSGQQFTVVVLTLSGSFYLGWLNRVSDYGGFDENIALRYKNCVTALAGILPDENLDTDNMSIHVLLNNKQSFLECVRCFINDLKEVVHSKLEEG